MKAKKPNYCELERYLVQTTHLKNILGLARWDVATMLSKGSFHSRHQEIATVASILHKMLISPEVGALIETARQEESRLNEWQKANLGSAEKIYKETQCITPEMQQKYSKATGECEFVWRSARKNNNFKELVPYLDRVFELVRDIASLKASHLDKKPYDVLLDMYAPDATSSSIKQVYKTLKAELPGLIQTILTKQASERIIPLEEKIDEAKQKAIGLAVIKNMGFSLDHGRLDESAHPFCSGSNDDIRLTTRYDRKNFLSGLMATIHEAGHGLYHQNLPPSYRDQPVGEIKGMAFHESQSIIMERQACSTLAFMTFLAKMLRDKLGFTGKAYEAENMYKLLTRVKPGFIRIEADEVTYPLHVILRFEIEELIIESSIKAKDLPQVWNEKMKKYLGITPPTDTLGCMQDIHWPSGFLGYFPAYTLGAIIASMLMQAAQKNQPKLEKHLEKGDFSLLNNYLNKNLRRFGSLQSSADLLAEATGYAQVEPAIFVNYLKKKYL